MEDIGKYTIIFICMVGIVFAQVEEVPASRTASPEPSIVETKSEADVIESSRDSAPAGRSNLLEQETEQMRSFVTINFMIIVIVILMVALALFLIINRARRNKRP